MDTSVVTAGSEQAQSYDAFPYDSLPLHPTHPSNLAVVATLAGRRAPPPSSARVLELGCASGGNLIPMAVNYGAGEFVGIDISPAQIRDGHAVLDELDLRNVRLEARSILDVDEHFGTFDYVICHGVYSWVPPAVQDHILRICARNLSSDGIAYVSYNTHPGWHLRGMVRDMMLYHVRGFTEPRERVAQARAFLDFLLASARDRDSAYTKFLGEEVDVLREAADSYLFHEHLESHNRPLYFSEFIEQAAAHGLDYLGEARPTSIKPGEFSQDVEDTVRRLAGDVVEFEQYLDFLRNRMFRRTLLCKTGAPIDRTWRTERLAGLHMGTPVRSPEKEARFDDGSAVVFLGPGDVKLTASHPWLKTAFRILGERWPDVLPYPDLEAAVESVVGSPADQDLQYLREAMLRCYVAGILETHVDPPPACTTPGARPVASPLARLQARAGTRVTSLRHRVIEIGEADRQILRRLDGSRDRAALASELDVLAARGEVTRDCPTPEMVERSVRALGLASLFLA